MLPNARTFFLLLLVLALMSMLPGCVSAPTMYDPTQLTPEQLKALARDKSTTITCTRISYMGLTTITTVFVNADMARVDGTVAVASDCGSAIQLAAPSRPASASQ